MSREEEIRARCDKATKGPWLHTPYTLIADKDGLNILE